MYYKSMHFPRTVFLGSPPEAIYVLEAIQRLKWPIAGVYTSADLPAGRGKKILKSPVKEYAEKMQLPFFTPSDMASPSTIEQLKILEPEIIVLAAYGKLLPPEFLELAKLGALNVHPSLLPLYRGSIPVQAAILRGDGKTGVSLMLMDSGLDTGPVIAQKETTLSGNESTPDLSHKLFQMGAELLIEYGPDFVSGKMKAKPQAEGSKPLRRLKKESGNINWLKSAIQIYREIRAYTPWPGSFSYWNNAKVDISGEVVPSNEKHTPGKVIKFNQKIYIATGEGLLEIVKIKIEGRKEQNASDFVRGHPKFIGAILPS